MALDTVDLDALVAEAAEILDNHNAGNDERAFEELDLLCDGNSVDERDRQGVERRLVHRLDGLGHTVSLLPGA
jgi:hypothetical protein